jgi:DNA end-binding protein Ku
VRQFIAQGEIDPIFYDRPYFLMPAEGSAKAYRLLAETMARAERAAIATFVMRGKEYLVAISADDGLLRLQTLRFDEEVRSAETVGLPTARAAKAGEVKLVQREMRALYADAAAPADLVDDRDRALLELIAAKERDDQDVIRAHTPPAPGDAVVIDLMEKLKQSLGRRQAPPKRPKRKSRAA